MMERKNGRTALLPVWAAICAVLAGGCAKDGSEAAAVGNVKVEIELRSPSVVKSSYTPDEDKISDLNVFFFSSEEGSGNGPCLEERVYVRSAGLSRAGNVYSFHTKLLSGKPYDIYVAANLGYEMSGVRTLKELKSYRFHLAYPDELRSGIPMSGYIRSAVAGEDEWGESVFRVSLRRLMSKVSLSIDRSLFGKGFEYNVKSVKICGSPRSALLFGSGGASSREDFFASGYTKSDSDAAVLNTRDGAGRSGETTLYCLENIQDGSDTTLCSYMEIEAEYKSDTLRSLGGNSLIYRFYLGSEKEPYILRRNHEYKVTVMPVGRGLGGNGWRVDTENLDPYNDIYYHFYPANYIECRIGDKVHVWCDYSPPYAKLVIDHDLLEESVGSGIWTYEIDEDGRGVTFDMKSGGMGLCVFDVYEPVNDGSLCVIMCEP